MICKGDENMKKMKNLNNYQKGILIFMLIMSIVFAVIYSMTISKVGYEYNDVILVPIQENGITIYQGKIKGEKAQFTVSKENIVIFEYGNRTYGPYSAKEDPTAIPKDFETMTNIIGVEVRQGEDIVFRGGVSKNDDFHWLYNEDGSFYHSFSYADYSGVIIDENGNVVDPYKPSVFTILDLMNNPELTHKGDWSIWFYAVFVCILNALSILFVDELFRFNLSFQIRNAHNAEPSDLEIVGRYVSWTIFVIGALVLFVIGLK